MKDQSDAAAVIQPRTLTESETRTYLLKRGMAAHLIHKPLTHAQVKKFYQLTKGNLAKIDSSVEAFLLSCANQKKSNKMAIGKKVGIAITVAVFVGVFYLYFANTYTYPHFFKTAKQPSKVKVVEQPVTPQLLESYIASWQDSSTRQLVYSGLPRNEVLDDIDEEQGNDPEPIVDKVVIIPIIKAKNLLTEEESSVDEQRQDTKLVKLTQSTKQIVIQAPSRLYTIQLLASHNERDVKRFKQSNKILNKTTRIKHFTNAKGNWIVLTLGEYKNRKIAQQKIKELPPELAKLNPWVRTVSGLIS